MKEVEIINIDDKEYALIDTIKSEENTYNYFVNTENAMDFCILKEDVEDYISLDNEAEFNKALSLYKEKHKDDNLEETTI